ncbi:DUF349 domain-containing protein [Reichenbachiella carrageenanivorans]|uniref:DUF349 domain-containing protein n=1 Tax=Reichenbachiella carrageenanivorans TaxID=2979869 RepID=A0ABY6D1Q0_9BACT|nr:DUF349 domain-containing protein [Reichenbachiella carrageenanivorans]UXX79530.1 DUF349 domain-containing protein [Reichenbachiella carrageenanivorans]
MRKIFCLWPDFVNLQPIYQRKGTRQFIVEIPYGHVENNVLFRSAFGQVEALKLKELSEEEITDAVSFFEAKFDKLKQKLDEIEDKINTQSNKGSFLSSLQNIEETISSHEGLGDYQSQLDRIAPLKALLGDYIQKNRAKNTDIKQALLLELEVVLTNNDQEEAFEQIKDLKSRWLKTGSPEQSTREELEGKFKAGVDSFYEKRNTFTADKQMLVNARMEEYQSIIAEIKSFIDKKAFQHTFEKVKELQKQWKDIGRIPEADFKAINDTYWKVTQEYFEKQKKHRNAERKQKSKGEKESLKAKTEILEELKVLVVSTFGSDHKAFEALKTKWKNSGHVSRKAHPEVHESFMQLSREWQERGFIWNLTQKKNKGFAKKETKDQYKDLLRVVRDLLQRDETELKSFHENMGNMHINKGSFVDMLNDKLQVQQDKVALKKSLLKECQEKIKQA